MKLDPQNLTIDLKVQSKYRQLLSQLGNGAVELQCVMLGDSDVDYALGSDTQMKTKVLSSPYNVEGIRYPLIYNGLGKGVKGRIDSFARFINSDGTISSLYNYPTNSNLTVGQTPPTRQNDFSWERITFTSSKMGVIIFFQTLLDFYTDENGLQERLGEKYKFQVLFDGSSTVPSDWEIIYDYDNGSMLIAKNSLSVGNDYIGTIGVIGVTSGAKRIIYFNY